MKIIINANDKTLKIKEGKEIKFKSNLADKKLEIEFNCTHCSWIFSNEFKRDRKK